MMYSITPHMGGPLPLLPKLGGVHFGLGGGPLRPRSSPLYDVTGDIRPIFRLTRVNHTKIRDGFLFSHS